MKKTKEYIKGINVSSFNGTICISEGEFERHLEEFAKQQGLEFYRMLAADLLAIGVESKGTVASGADETWKQFLKEES